MKQKKRRAAFETDVSIPDDTKEVKGTFIVKLLYPEEELEERVTFERHNV